MIAWVSPSLMVSVTPVRISFSSLSAFTDTWRSLISRVLIGVLLRSGWWRRLRTRRCRVPRRGRWRPARWPAVRSACRCAGRSGCRAASTPACTRPPRPRSGRLRRASTCPRPRTPRRRTARARRPGRRSWHRSPRPHGTRPWNRHAQRSCQLLEDVLGEFGLDGGGQLLLELGDGDLADQVVEEAAHDQALGLLLRDAP